MVVGGKLRGKQSTYSRIKEILEDLVWDNNNDYFKIVPTVVAGQLQELNALIYNECHTKKASGR